MVTPNRHKFDRLAVYSEKVKFEWTVEKQDSVSKLKKALFSSPDFAYLDFAKPFIVATGILSGAIGTVFNQKDDNGMEHPYIAQALD